MKMKDSKYEEQSLPSENAQRRFGGRRVRLPGYKHLTVLWMALCRIGEAAEEQFVAEGVQVEHATIADAESAVESD